MFLKFKLLPSNAAVTNTVEFVFHRDIIDRYYITFIFSNTILLRLYPALFS